MKVFTYGEKGEFEIIPVQLHGFWIKSAAILVLVMCLICGIIFAALALIYGNREVAATFGRVTPFFVLTVAPCDAEVYLNARMALEKKEFIPDYRFQYVAKYGKSARQAARRTFGTWSC